MKRRALVVQIFPVYFFIVFISLFLVVFFTLKTFRSFYLDQVARDLEFQIEWIAKEALHDQSDAAMVAFANRWKAATETRLTLINPTGRVLADTDRVATELDDHSDRPEVIQALKLGVGQSTRFSQSVMRDLMYVAKVYPSAKNPKLVIRSSLPLLTLEETFQSVYIQIILIALGVAGLAGVASLVLARRISRPLKDLQSVAQRYASGDLSHRLALPDTEEIAVLAESMNLMAEELSERIETITRQRNETDAILYSMVEGVLAFDHEERILSFNQAALDLFEIDAPHIYGKSVQGIFRNSDLINFVALLLRERRPVEAEVVIQKSGTKKHIQTQGSVLKDANDQIIGGLVVFHDVTRIRQLEGMRRNFVANVSHELRTPLTSIKGFVETLLEGAIDEPEEARHFLGIISGQADRLNETIHDLLKLSQIEREAEAGQIQRIEANMIDVVQSAVDICSTKAQQKQVAVIYDKPEEDVLTKVNVRLMEQAVMNLIDNAIQYSPENTTVTVNLTTASDGEIEISVQDEGPGIEKKHLDRIFERFYRVDKARSRNLGGSGLGLAIVKHIAGSHGGQVSVTSEPGKGSRFSISIPANT